MIKRLFPIFGFVLITFIFFWQVFFKGLLPIPADTIVGLYHPYRDVYAKDYPNGIPFKNFLITDPVRQQYPWKNLSIDSLKKLELPLWNPYSFSGTPNIANFQSSVFYPLNLVLFLGSFEYSWTFLILLQPLLASIFMYLYLRNLRLDVYSSFFGGVIFAFSGFSAMWLEWGTVLNTALWLPLILLGIDKSCEYLNTKKTNRNFKVASAEIKNGKLIAWIGVLTFSISFSFFAGHLQTFFYLSIFSVIYLLIRIWKSKEKLKTIIVIGIAFLITAIISLPQFVPSLKFISLSGRELDQLVWQKEGWFIPVQHLVQFFAPDFFGNPSTLNYWGTWNYGELTGFVGIIAITLSMYAIIFRRDKKTILLTLAVFASLFFAMQNPISKIPFIFNLPFISTAQPTRLLFIIDFSLSILAALGLNYFILKGKLKQIAIPIVIIGSVLLILFAYVQLNINLVLDPINASVANRNILFPGMIFVASSLLLISYAFVKGKFKNYLLLFLIIFTVVELFRFSWKFNTFSKSEYMYPESSTINFIQENLGNYRIATADPRIMPPNFPIMHKIYSAEGYDPLYLERYGEFVAAINRNSPDIDPPFGFNRIIRIEKFSSSLVDLIGIKYVLSLTDLEIEGFKKVHEDGQTKIYENTQVIPKAFFVNEIKESDSNQATINMMFSKLFDPRRTAVVEQNMERTLFNTEDATARIVSYSGDEVKIETNNTQDGFLIFTDSYYPTWHAMINNQEIKIYRTDYNFRGVFIPAGKQTIIFKNNLL